MKRSTKQRHLFSAVTLAAALGCSAFSAQAITPFEQDVETAIDRGLSYLNSIGAFVGSSGDATGLAMEALLEKRPPGFPAAPAQGYSGANAADQARLRSAATYIINRTNITGFYAYRDGQNMFALAEYAMTAGPDQSTLGSALTLKQAMDKIVDRTLFYQRKASNGYPNPVNQGYWCYTHAGCEDSSTTQFATAGLAAAKAFYTSGLSADSAFDDPARAAAIDIALGLVKQAYELNARQGADNASCRILTATERGHGYRSKSYNPSLQQTASGVYIQLFGGSNVNTPSVQNYLEWLHNRYRWQDLDSLGNSWPTLSYWYYLWSSFKGAQLMRLSGLSPDPGNLGPDDLGNLPAGNAPVCGVRQVNKVPAAYPRVPSFGAGGVGYYAGEPQGQYFDYAHQIIGHQCANGYFGCNSAPGRWNTTSGQSYALLVLLRSTGGGCVDTDNDGVCDADDNCPADANAGQEDGNGDGVGDACQAICDVDLDSDIDRNDLGLILAARNQPAIPVDPRDADVDGTITVLDARKCTLMCTAARCAVLP